MTEYGTFYIASLDMQCFNDHTTTKANGQCIEAGSRKQAEGGCGGGSEPFVIIEAEVSISENRVNIIKTSQTRSSNFKQVNHNRYFRCFRSYYRIC